MSDIHALPPIRSCPFCDGPGALSTDGPSGQGHDVDHFVHCLRCGARGERFAEGWKGPAEECQKQAVRKWNTRRE